MILIQKNSNLFKTSSWAINSTILYTKLNYNEFSNRTISTKQKYQKKLITYHFLIHSIIQPLNHSTTQSFNHSIIKK
jgi:hypothetical protein